MLPEEITTSAQEVLLRFERKGWSLATAESCTGGLIAASLTAIPGSSSVIDRGFVTYTNQSKMDLLGVPPSLFDTVGAVSEDVARAMVTGALNNAPVDAAVAVTGIAGPGGSTTDKPVGLVYIAVRQTSSAPNVARCHFEGDRNAVREATVLQAFHMLKRLAD